MHNFFILNTNLFNSWWLVVKIWMQFKHMHQISADALLCVVVLGSLSAEEQVSQFSPKLESGWRALLEALLDSNWKPKISLFSMSKTQKRRFKINEMLNHKEVALLRNWLVSAEKPYWYPHDDVTARKLMSLSFLQQQTDKKAFHAGGHLLLCCSCMLLNTFS